MLDRTNIRISIRIETNLFFLVVTALKLDVDRVDNFSRPFIPVVRLLIHFSFTLLSHF